MNIIDRIIELSNNRNLTGKEIGGILGLKKSPLTDWKNNKSRPTLEQIITLCDFFAVTSDYLLFGGNQNIVAPIQFTADEQNLVKSFNTLNNKQKTVILGKIYEYEEDNKKEHLKKVTAPLRILETSENTTLEPDNQSDCVILPLYPQKASAGIGKYLYDSPECEETSFNVDIYPQAKRADHAITVEGNSMLPTIKDGQYIFIREQSSIEHNEIGVFVYKDNVYCKRLHIDRKNKRLILVSDNEDYDDILVKNLDELRTIGKVIL